MSRINDLDRFYNIMQKLEIRLGGKRILDKCNGRMPWPNRGVYFFYEEGERRDNSDLRVVRVGTHALKQGSSSSLWKRLNQHKGTDKGRYPGGGNHRGSVFRLHVGTAVISKNALKVPSWSVGSSAKGIIREVEYPVEKLVSQHIGSMPFLLVNVNDEAGPNSIRGYIERNSIALLSNSGKSKLLDLPSPTWLGKYAWKEKISDAGIWNVNHVDEPYEREFLGKLQNIVEGIE